jgi:organic hydroperoxide reductase OsmC/OhrA
MPARGSAEWKGDLPTGAGTFTAGDTITGGYTFKSRFEDGSGSNPEQLIAAAHAAAKAGCPVSRALAAVPEITLEASLIS